MTRRKKRAIKLNNKSKKNIMVDQQAKKQDPKLIVSQLKFNEKGLIPAIIQDYKKRDILMMAWMNEESLSVTIKEKRTCFWSRSRKELWRKGDTSGNIQKVKSIYYDCDMDVLLIEVEQIGGIACHTGERSCFYRKII